MIYGTNSTRNNSVSTRSIGLLIMTDAIIDIMVSYGKGYCHYEVHEALMLEEGYLCQVFLQYCLPLFF